MPDNIIDALKHSFSAPSKFPYDIKISLRGVDININNIVTLDIKETIFDVTPTIKLIFKDTGYFIDVFPLGDEDELKLTISTSKEYVGIDTSFSVDNYTMAPVNGVVESYTITLNGHMKCENIFHPIRSRAIKDISSGAIETIYTDMGLKVVVDSETNDAMTWLQPYISNHDMIKHLINYSYKEDDNLLFAYADRNRYAYIKDYITESQKEFTVSFTYTVGSTSDYYYNRLKRVTQKRDKKITKLAFSGYNILSNRGTDNKTGGYGILGSYFDYSTSKQVMQLQNTNLHPLTTYSTKNISAKNEPVDIKYLPMKYNGANYHRNYHKAFLQNRQLRKSLFSDLLVITSYFNDEVKLFDKITIDIPATKDNDNSNKILSGQYLVVGIVQHIDKYNSYRSTVYLSRGGINAPTLAKEEMKLNGN